MKKGACNDCGWHIADRVNEHHKQFMNSHLRPNRNANRKVDMQC